MAFLNSYVMDQVNGSEQEISTYLKLKTLEIPIDLHKFINLTKKTLHYIFGMKLFIELVLDYIRTYFDVLLKVFQ